MTTQRLLEKLRDQLKEIQGAIKIVEALTGNEKAYNKGKEILKSVKRRKWSPEQRKKFLATMKARRNAS